jgi:hypothetical protein
MREPDPTAGVNPAAIRAAMPQRSRHARQRLLVDTARLAARDSSNSAH